jgi:hypothetical protein
MLHERVLRPGIAAVVAVAAIVALGLAVSNSAHAVDDVPPKAKRLLQKNGKAVDPKNAARIVDPKNAVDPRNAARLIDPKNVGRLLDPKNALRVDPKNAAHVDPKNAAKIDPNNAARIDPKNAAKLDPKNAARIDPKNAGKNAAKIDPKNAARIDPKNAALGKNNPTALRNQQLLNANRAALDPRRLVERQRFFADHRRLILATRLRLPQRPMIGQPGFTGVPPVSERRYVQAEMMFHVGANVSRAQVEAVARKHNMSIVATQTSELTGGTIYICRADRGQQVVDAVRAMEAEKIGVAQPNYVFTLVQEKQPDAPGAEQSSASERPVAGDKPAEAAADDPALQQDLAARTTGVQSSQYVIGKLKLDEVHRLATGSNVLVAVIDSKIDVNHPDLAGTVVEEFDAVGRPGRPDNHGTGMVGAIVAQRKLMGVAPGSKILAIHAFSTDGKDTAQATTKHILAGIDYAIKRGARVINMSFAGPYDPMLQLAMKRARDKGVVLVAAAGNAGPKSPPLYPAADPNVIGVTATDEEDKLFSGANRGPQVAVAAPGVNILEPAPNASYQVTTGTSVAAAHVSGVAALLIEKNPSLKPDAVFEILTSSAKPLAPKGRDDDYGWGLVDPAKALATVDEKLAIDAVAAKPAGKPTASRTGAVSAR